MRVMFGIKPKEVTMHFVLSKAIGFLSVPSNVIASLAVLGLLLVVLRRPFGRIVTTVALVTLVLAALSPLGNALLTPLEQRYPELRYPDQGIDGIIVLGGSYDSVSHAYASVIVLEEDTEPMAVMVDLARRYPRANIIFSGGTNPSWGPGPSEAAIVKQYFVSFGIAAERISIEERSLTTEENARFTAQLAHPTPSSRWLLVTSAYHMPRAMGTFRKAGFNVVAFSVGQRTHGWDELWWPATTATDNLRRVDIAAHEWLGLIAYRLSGYSDEWFPGPYPSAEGRLVR
jgi:uncharacterized SAM-binding protein YcdF (DUF218 family)